MTNADLFGQSQGEREAEGAAVNCPFCRSSDTEFFSLFGSQLLTAQYYCRSCHTPFERVKDAAVVADAARRDLANAPPRPLKAEPGTEEEQR
jgi:hypothetical protein